MGIVSYLMILFEEGFSPLFAYTATVLLVVSIGGLINIILLIMELRVPPKNIAAVQLMTRTIATAFGILAPTIASLSPPIPYIVLPIISTFGFIASTRLPDPGHHLPKVEYTEAKNAVIVTQESETAPMLHDFTNPGLVEPTPQVYHSISH